MPQSVYRVSANVSVGQPAVLDNGTADRRLVEGSDAQNFVDDGASVTVEHEFSPAQIHLDSGVIYLVESDPMYLVHLGSTSVSAEVTGTNYVYLRVPSDFEGETMVEVVVSDVGPEDTSFAEAGVLLATVDTSTNADPTPENRWPSLKVQSAQSTALDTMGGDLRNSTVDPRKRYERATTRHGLDTREATFQDFSDWIAWRGDTVEVTTEETYRGSQALHCYDSGGNTYIGADFEPGSNFDMVEQSHLSIAVKQTLPDDQVTFQVLLWDDGNNIQNYEVPHTPEGNGTGWKRMNLSPRGYVSGFNYNSIQRIRVRADVGGSEAEFWADDIRFTPATDKGRFLLTFDDNTDELYSRVLPILEDYGLTATFGVTPDWMGDDNRLTVDEAQELVDAGWEPASHFWDGSTLNAHPPEEQREMVRRAKQWLLERGLTTADGDVKAFVYPGGQYDVSGLDAVGEYHEVGFNAYSSATSSRSPSHPHNPLLMNRTAADIGVSGVESVINGAINYNCTGAVYIHTVGPDGELTEADLRSICDYLATREDRLDVLTASGLLRHDP